MSRETLMITTTRKIRPSGLMSENCWVRPFPISFYLRLTLNTNYEVVLHACCTKSNNK
jgi:hypothetical protein